MSLLEEVINPKIIKAVFGVPGGGLDETRMATMLAEAHGLAKGWYGGAVPEDGGNRVHLARLAVVLASDVASMNDEMKTWYDTAEDWFQTQGVDKMAPIAVVAKPVVFGRKREKTA